MRYSTDSKGDLLSISNTLVDADGNECYLTPQLIDAEDGDLSNYTKKRVRKTNRQHVVDYLTAVGQTEAAQLVAEMKLETLAEDKSIYCTLSSLFVWHESPQGYDYWCTLSARFYNA